MLHGVEWGEFIMSSSQFQWILIKGKTKSLIVLAGELQNFVVRWQELKSVETKLMWLSLQSLKANTFNWKGDFSRINFIVQWCVCISGLDTFRSAKRFWLDFPKINMLNQELMPTQLLPQCIQDMRFMCSVRWGVRL